MAANRFATMLHRNTNKITLILIYAVLEWILIVLLLLSSLFSYLIIQFAEFFGLKPPCPWCTRIDHVFDPSKGDKNMNRELLCEVHSKEISKLGFCSNHEKLVDSGNMCDDCLSSRPEFQGSFRDFDIYGKTKDLGDFLCEKEKIGENSEVSLNCSCCGVSFDSNCKCSSYILPKTSSRDDVSGFAHEENLITEAGDHVSAEMVSDLAADLHENEKLLEYKSDNQMISEIEGNLWRTEEDNDFICVTVNESKGLETGENEILKEEISKSITKDKSVQVCSEEDYALENSTQHLEFFLDFSGHKLVPVELIDSVIEEDDVTKDREVSVYSENHVEEKEGVVIESGGRIENAFLDFDINEEPKYALVSNDFGKFGVFSVGQWPSEDVSSVQVLDREGTDKRSDYAACEEVYQENNENEADVSIGTEIPDLYITDEIQIQESNNAYESIHEDPLTSSANRYAADDHAPMQIEEQAVEIGEDKVRDSPTYMDNLNSDKRLLLLEKRESWTEESLDGSVTSELDGYDGVITIERLKSSLRAERKALQALYVELEEERSASAVATNQTMAMINRLQEEKAAMQMEALQYQRMMEEQSEYDQEALQLLNELMVKREKEKQELERELEVYRKKLTDYETKEKKTRALRKIKDASVRSDFSSEDSDGLSIDSNQEVKEEEGIFGNSDMSNRNTPVDAVVDLVESFDDFEEERLLILDQLKVLEGKLLTSNDENRFEGVKAIDDLHENGEENVHENGYLDGKRYKHGRIAARNGKSLLPLFDSISDDNEYGDVMINGNENGFDLDVVHDSYESKFEEEFDNLYERLHALEADREFIRHCVSSLMKGDKGIDLLQEILQHLRDLRNVELRVRNLDDVTII